MDINKLNNLPPEEAKAEFERCCGAHRWVEKITASRPFINSQHLFEMAEKIWYELDEADWLEAFIHHPKIGDVKTLAKKYENTKQWAEGEQSGVKQANEDVIRELAQGNSDYENKFGYIFIVCATGKSASEMLALLKKRLHNDPSEELKIAAGEQNKITKIRLEKMLSQT